MTRFVKHLNEAPKNVRGIFNLPMLGKTGKGTQETKGMAEYVAAIKKIPAKDLNREIPLGSISFSLGDLIEFAGGTETLKKKFDDADSLYSFMMKQEVKLSDLLGQTADMIHPPNNSEIGDWCDNLLPSKDWMKEFKKDKEWFTEVSELKKRLSKKWDKTIAKEVYGLFKDRAKTLGVNLKMEPEFLAKDFLGIKY